MFDTGVNKYDQFLEKLIKDTKNDLVEWREIDRTLSYKIIPRNEVFNFGFYAKINERIIAVYLFSRSESEEIILTNPDIAILDNNEKLQIRLLNDANAALIWRLLKIVQRKCFGIDSFIDDYMKSD